MDDYVLWNSSVIFSVLLLDLPPATRAGLPRFLFLHLSFFGFQVEGWYLL